MVLKASKAEVWNMAFFEAKTVPVLLTIDLKQV